MGGPGTHDPAVARRGGYVPAAIDWAALSDADLAEARRLRAAQITTINRDLAAARAGTTKPNPAAVAELKARAERLNAELATIKQTMTERRTAPVRKDAGRSLSAMTNAELVAYADELDAEIGEIKEDLGVVQGLRAIALGELGRRRIPWKAKH